MTDTKTKEIKEMTELEILQAQAELLGIPFRKNTPAKTLRESIKEALAVSEDDSVMTEAKRKEMEDESLKLMRVIISPRASHMQDQQGQLFTIGNAYLGMHTKYVLFNEEYHIPFILYNHIKNQQAQIFVSKTVKGQKVRESKLIPAYNVTDLEPLTKEELAELARIQESRNASE